MHAILLAGGVLRLREMAVLAAAAGRLMMVGTTGLTTPGAVWSSASPSRWPAGPPRQGRRRESRNRKPLRRSGTTTGTTGERPDRLVPARMRGANRGLRSEPACMCGTLQAIFDQNSSDMAQPSWPYRLGAGWRFFRFAQTCPAARARSPAACQPQAIHSPARAPLISDFVSKGTTAKRPPRLREVPIKACVHAR